MGIILSPFFFEELLHEGFAFFFEDAACDGAFGMEGVGSVALEAAFLVVGSIDEAAYLCPSDGSGAHGAGLDSDVEGALRQVFATELVGCHGDGLHLGMGGDVVEGLGEVVGACDDAVATHDDGSDGYLASGFGGSSLFKGFAHVGFVEVHIINLQFLLVASLCKSA